MERDEIIDPPKKGISKFVSGQDDWHNPSSIAERTKLIESAKGGCSKAKYTLMNHPHNISELVIARQTII